MLTKAFNCPDCKKSLDCEPLDCRKRVSCPPSMHREICHRCSTGSYKLPQLGLIEFLSQPAFKRTDEGYEYTLPINDPICVGCEGKIKVSEGAFLAQCSHYFCKSCRHKQLYGSIINCSRCRVAVDVCTRTCPNLWGADRKLAAFFEEIRDSFYEYEAKKAAERKDRAQKDCGDCGMKQPVDRLFKCMDCQRINCGNCFYDSHREHSVVKLLGIALEEMEGQHDKRYTESLEGLHGHLKYVERNSDNAVVRVLMAGKDRLAKMKQCTEYERASKIAEKVEKAAEDFEKEFDEYFPVARKFATRLEKLGEELMEEEE